MNINIQWKQNEHELSHRERIIAHKSLHELAAHWISLDVDHLIVLDINNLIILDINNLIILDINHPEILDIDHLEILDIDQLVIFHLLPSS